MKMNEQMEELCLTYGADYNRLMELLKNHVEQRLPLTLKWNECAVVHLAMTIAGE